MIPAFDPATGLLPPGVHDANWEEIVARFGDTPHRLALLAAGCRRAYVDGSFVTAKRTPADFDGCWEVEGVDLTRLDPVLMTFANLRAAQKRKYGGELFPAAAPADRDGTRFLTFFQRDRATGAPKGIVAIDLGGLP